VAIGLVVVYHVWFGRVSGGLDVFFLLSGFFVTLSLMSGLKREGRVDLGAYFGRLIMRLWPMALLVLAAITVATWLLMPESRWDEIQQQVVAASLYFENWHLAAISTDYLADHWGGEPGAALLVAVGAGPGVPAVAVAGVAGGRPGGRFRTGGR